MFSWEVGILHDQFSNAGKSVVEASGDVRHFPFGGGIPRDVIVDGDVRRGIAGVHRKIALVPIG